MPKTDRKEITSRPAGYAALIELFALQVAPNWHKSWVVAKGGRRVHVKDGVTEEIFPCKYWPGDTLGRHLEFALKHDGTNLGILFDVFAAAPEVELLEYLRSKPTGQYARRLWFLYEHLTGKDLPLEDLRQGNYVDLLDTDVYYTVSPGRRIPRQRINNNLLGAPGYCPTVRRTQTLRDFENADLPERCRRIVAEVSPEFWKRALAYLYAKETKSSFEIEHITPTASRAERFANLLHSAGAEDFCERPKLISLQNQVVDARFRDADYRGGQNYVGETVSWQSEKIHFAAPKPEDLAGLMAGWTAAHQRMAAGAVSPVVHAAAIAYGFVFLHPFEDGNGRIHRFLIHNILARRGYTPHGVMFPVSAAMLQQPAGYDGSLEAFSRPLMALVEYTLDEEGRMTVHNDTAALYRFMDLTPQAEALFGFIAHTMDVELPGELAFLESYDQARTACKEIVDLPQRRLDLFIRFCLQNNGRLSVQKRAANFANLSDGEIALLEQAVQSAYGIAPAG